MVTTITSLNRTVRTADVQRCWALTAEKAALHTPSFRGYAEMLYSGALSAQQVSEIYDAA